MRMLCDSSCLLNNKKRFRRARKVARSMTTTIMNSMWSELELINSLTMSKYTSCCCRRSAAFICHVGKELGRGIKKRSSVARSRRMAQLSARDDEVIYQLRKRTEKFLCEQQRRGKTAGSCCSCRNLTSFGIATNFADLMARYAITM